MSGSVLLVGKSAELVAEALASESVSVRRATTAAEALAAHRAEKADLIVLDLDLPDGVAEAFCQTVRQDRQLRDVSLLVLCGSAEAERRRAADCRANAHVVVPADAKALAREVMPLLAVSERASYRVLALVQVEGQTFFCTSANLSASGILLESPRPLWIGQTLGCSFFLPGKVRVEASGRVVREGESDRGRVVGVQFVDPAPEAVAAIEAFVEEWTRPR